MNNFVELVLTCGSWQEAQKIADAVLQKKLVACVEFMEIKSKYWWKHELESAQEVKLIMETIADKFSDVEAEVRKHHSYDTFVLQQIPITRLNAEATTWLQEQTKDA